MALIIASMTLSPVECLHEDREIGITRLAVRHADTDHIAFLEARERHPGSARGNHPGDHRARLAERCGWHDIQQRKRRVVHDAPAALLELATDPRGLRDCT